MRRLTNVAFLERYNSFKIYALPLEEYTKGSVPLLFQCTLCGNKWRAKPSFISTKKEQTIVPCMFCNQGLGRNVKRPRRIISVDYNILQKSEEHRYTKPVRKPNKLLDELTHKLMS